MATFDTDFPADTLEFCPNEGFRDIFVCGTYRLLDHPASLLGGSTSENSTAPPPPAKRIGQCLVFRVGKSRSPSDRVPLEHVQSLDFPAVPDVKWCHGSALEKPTLGVADSEGSVTVCQWDDANELQRISSVRCADATTLCLSLDWNNRLKGSSNLGDLVVSLSNGSLCHLKPDSSGVLTVANGWHAHDYEPWVASWNHHDINLIYSGGDDLKLKAWDTRAGFDTPVLVNKRFDGGVTCIQSNPHDPKQVAVGSYDSTVRIFDPRNLARPVSDLAVGGGVWRVKWHPEPERKSDLLVACMHDGFKIARFPAQVEEHEPTITKEFREHESLAYGADWSFSKDTLTTEGGGGESLVGSCSFYDHKLHVWSG